MLLARIGGHAAEGVLPPRTDLSTNFAKWNLPLRKQGARNTCSVFTAVQTIEYALARRQDRGEPLSIEFANWAANRAIKENQDGQFFSSVIKGYEEYGLCPQTEMAYQGKFDPALEPSTSAVAKARKLRRANVRFHWIREWDGKPGLEDRHIQAAKQVLAKGWPVAAGSYHSILLVGYEDDPSLPGGGQFLVRDSGSRNEATLSYAAAKERMIDLFWAEPGERGAPAK
jgi:hypothetical protein